MKVHNSHELPKVQTQKEFMDALYDRIRPPRTPTNNDESPAGRPPDLKTYLIESNSSLNSSFNTDKFGINIGQTGLDHIKILTMTNMNDSDEHLQFYLDISDKRFLVFHTFDLAKNVTPAIEHLFNSRVVEFDKAWLSTDMLKSISNDVGNIECGYEVRHKDYFQSDVRDDIMSPDIYSNISISGSQSSKILQLLRDDEDISRLLGYNKVIVSRGTKSSGVIEDIYYYGKFNVVKGDSVDDHISLVDMTKDRYRNLIYGIEKHGIYGDPDTKTVKGEPFEFVFNRQVDDWDRVLDIMFNSKEPFMVWGVKNQISDDFYQILGVDIHTGHPFDVEITDNTLCVYLPKGSCGNLVARLFVNFQMFFDSQVKCPRLES